MFGIDLGIDVEPCLYAFGKVFFYVVGCIDVLVFAFGEGRVECSAEFLVEATVDGRDSDIVDGVGKLVYGYVFAAITVVRIGEYVLLCTRTHG